jgi:hypothetical protein
MHDQRILFIKPGNLTDFVMVDRPAAADVVALVKSRALEPRDGVVLLALLANWQHSDNTTSYCSQTMAEQLGTSRQNLIGSLNRLRRAGLLARWQPQPQRGHYTTLGSRGLLSPLFATSGGKGQRAQHLERFREALE